MKPKAQVALTKGHRSKAHEPFGEEGDRATACGPGCGDCGYFFGSRFWEPRETQVGPCHFLEAISLFVCWCVLRGRSLRRPRTNRATEPRMRVRKGGGVIYVAANVELSVSLVRGPASVSKVTRASQGSDFQWAIYVQPAVRPAARVRARRQSTGSHDQIESIFKCKRASWLMRRAGRRGAR